MVSSMWRAHAHQRPPACAPPCASWAPAVPLRGKRGLNTCSVPGLLWATTGDRDLGEDCPPWPSREERGGSGGQWGEIRRRRSGAYTIPVEERGLLEASEGRSEGGGQALAQFWWRRGGFLLIPTLPALWPSPGHGLGHTHTHTHTHTHRVTQLFHESVVRKILHLFLDPKTFQN